MEHQFQCVKGDLQENGDKSESLEGSNSTKLGETHENKKILLVI